MTPVVNRCEFLKLCEKSKEWRMVNGQSRMENDLPFPVLNSQLTILQKPNHHLLQRFPRCRANGELVVCIPHAE